ncbi:uncharacterized protein LOC120334444 [Styela clava]|uniref:uncharacterized protein LOC120334444 n=1 Tax=Styela clava TaxID=7725 RepID=UPI001939502F|nr:uncharacterized protein LOC120334444 [Styela clava]
MRREFKLEGRIYIVRRKNKKMNRTNGIHIAFGIVYLATLVIAEQCQIPTPIEDIDVDKFPKTWYQGLHTNDPVMSEDVLCSKLQNFTKTKEGWKMVITEYHKNSPPRVFPSRHIRQRKGVYTIDKKDDLGTITSQTLSSDGGFNEAAAAIDDALLSRELLELSDYKNYFITAFCSLTGEWIVWAHFPTPNPDVRQVSKMWNTLIDYRIAVKLYPCKKINWK